MSFSLHPRLAADTAEITDFPLCRVLLMRNANFPWLILVPRRENVRELFDLSETDREQLMREITRTGKALQAITHAEKINIAALGNQVPQLHMHVIARFTHDAAWPNPVWNSGVSARIYDAAELAQWVVKLRDTLPRFS